jgi:hypothetical protein
MRVAYCVLEEIVYMNEPVAVVWFVLRSLWHVVQSECSFFMDDASSAG